MHLLFNNIKAMKKLVITFIFLIAAVAIVKAETPVLSDSIIVQFGNNTRMVIHAKDKKDLLSLRQYDLNKIVRDMGIALDTTDKETYVYINEKNGRKYLQDTVLVISRKDGRVKISIKDPIADKDTTDKDKRSEVGKADNDDDKDEEDTKDDDDNEEYTKTVTRRYKSPRNGFNALIGLNVYGKNNPLTNYTAEDYNLIPIQSRFVSFGWVRGTPLSRGRNASFGIDLGIDVNWYNMMYDGNNTIKKTVSSVTFPEILGQKDIYKSKLTATYVNLSLMPTLALHHGSLSYLSVGMYAGYRIDAYAKVKEERRGNVERTRSGFFLNDFRYGVGAEIGIRNFPDIFMQYDLNQLFQSNKGPAIQMLSFGLRF